MGPFPLKLERIVPNNHPHISDGVSHPSLFSANEHNYTGARWVFQAGEAEKFWISWSLAWIAYAERPLKPGELLCALAVASESIYPNIRNGEPPEARYLFLLWLSLLLDRNGIIDSLADKTMERGCAMAALLQLLKEVNGDQVHESIAYTCLNYLKRYPRAILEPPFAKPELHDHRLPSPMGLLSYAANYWPVHFRFGERSSLRLADLLQVTIGLALEALPVECRNQVGLMICARHDFAIVGQTYLEMGVEFDQLNGERTTPLHQTVIHGSRNLLQVALARGLDLSTTDDEGMTALHLAVRHGYPDVAEMLVKEGANVDQSYCDTGETALHMAARSGHNGILALLLSYGADDKLAINCPSKSQSRRRGNPYRLQALAYPPVPLSLRVKEDSQWLADGECPQCGLYEFAPGDGEINSGEDSEGSQSIRTTDSEIEFYRATDLSGFGQPEDHGSTYASSAGHGTSYEDDDMDGPIDDEGDDSGSEATMTSFHREARSVAEDQAFSSSDEPPMTTKQSDTQVTNDDESTEASESERSPSTSKGNSRARPLVISEDEDEDEWENTEGVTTEGSEIGGGGDDDDEERTAQEDSNSNHSDSEDWDIRPSQPTALRRQHLASQRARRNNHSYQPYRHSQQA